MIERTKSVFFLRPYLSLLVDFFSSCYCCVFFLQFINRYKPPVLISRKKIMCQNCLVYLGYSRQWSSHLNSTVIGRHAQKNRSLFRDRLPYFIALNIHLSYHIVRTLLKSALFLTRSSFFNCNVINQIHLHVINSKIKAHWMCHA